jgi:hypothetical protein
VAKAATGPNCAVNELSVLGSGKTTLSKAAMVRLPQFHRLSIDEIIFKKHGLYGVDYSPDMDLYQRYLEEAGEIYLDEFQ